MKSALSLQIVPKSSFKPVPWKNGGGITHEAMRVPAHGDDFVWRVSVAQIDASGPFSDFAAYHRTMVLLEGAGLELKFGDGRQRLLGRIGESVQFDGALATHCRLLEGPCVDLNLMVAKTRTMVARVEQLQESREISASQGESTLIFGVDAPLVLDAGSGVDARRLEPWDLAVMTNGVVRVGQARRGLAPAAVFFATIQH
jgi:hypothetical protein